MSSTRLKSLRFRVCLITARGMIVFGMVITFLFSRVISANLREGLRAKAESIVVLLASNLVAVMDFDDVGAAGEVIAGVGKDPDFLWVLVARLDGSTMVAEGAKRAAGALDPAGMTEVRFFDEGGRVRAVAPIMVNGKPAGAVEVAFGTARVAEAASGALVTGLAVCFALVALVTAYLMLMMGRVVVRPVIRITGIVERLGDGDLTPIGGAPAGMSSELTGMYDALGRAASAFRGNVEAITVASTEFSRMADEILESTNTLSAAVGEQAAAVSETTVTLEQVEKTGFHSARNADKILSTAGESLQASERGLLAVTDGLDELRGIKAQVDTIADSLQRLNGTLKEVDAIVSSVNNVTRQSHTLSINASIEAAKAGVAGAGFSIVANQMRGLAEQSKVATDQVRTTLGQVRAAIHELNLTAESGRKATLKGVATIERAGEVIRRLTEVMDETTTMARVIATNVQQQLTGLQQTSQAMSQINTAAQSNLEGIRTVEDRGAQLNQKAGRMQAIVSRFRL